MTHGLPPLSRWLACSVLLLGLTLTGTGCREDNPPTPPPPARALPDAERSTVEVNPATGARANGVDGVDIQVKVRAADGTPLAGHAVTVAASGVGNTLQQPSGPTDAEGAASARLTSTAAGVKTVTVSVATEGGAVVLASQPSVEFVREPATRLAFTSAPGFGTAGAPLDAFEVVIQNAAGGTVAGAGDTVTLSLGDAPAGATLKGEVSVAAVNGVARFPSLVIEKAGTNYTLVARVDGLPEAKSPAFDVQPAAPSALALTASQTDVVVGTPVSLGLTVVDGFGNTVTPYTGTVRFSSDDGAASLPADYTFTPAAQGRHDFSNGFTPRTVGTSRQVTVTDRDNAALTGSVTFNVRPGTARRLVFTQQPATTSVRAPFAVRVGVVDALGNPVSVSSPGVTLAVNKGGTLAGTVSVAPVAGEASFPGLSIAQEAEGYVLTATASGLEPATSSAFTIVDDVPPAVPVVTQSGSTASSVTVAWTAVGDDGTAGTATRQELRYATTDITSEASFAAATLVTTGAPKAAGSAESAVISGLQQGRDYYVALKVTDNAGNSARSATRLVSTLALNASRLAFSVQPQSGTAGVALAPIKVEIRDAAGALVDTATSAVTLTVVGTSGHGPFTVSAVNGVATFSAVRIDTAGKGYTLKATAGSLTEATSTPFDIASAAAASLTLTGLPATVTAGSAQSLTVEVRDAFNNLAAGYTGTVRFTSSDTKAVLPADATFSATDAGRKTLSVTLNSVNGQSVTVKDVARGELTATASTVVNQGTPAKLVFQTQPTNGTVRAALGSVSVAIADASGNVLDVSAPTVSLHLVGGNASATLEGTLTATPSAGVATFSGLKIDQQGTGFRFEATAGTLNGASSNPFTLVDDLAPAAVTLRVEGTVTSTRVPLAWSAVGDDGMLGLASAYDLRYSTSPIDAANFASATQVLTDPPLPPGSAEAVEITGLTPSTRYYLALKVEDDAGNSVLAFASATTQKDPCIGAPACTAQPTVCGADGVSRISYTAACVDEDNQPVCQQSETVTACAGANAVCYQAACETAARPTGNQLAFSELMHSPTGTTTEYIELTNTTGQLLNLNGVTVTYRNSAKVTRSFQVGQGSVPVVVGRRGTFVLAHNKDRATNGGVSADYQYPDAIVLDGSGQFSVAHESTPVTDFLYTSAFPQTPGKAMNLSSAVVGTYADASPWYWCDATTALSGGNFGSPNAPNGTCGVSAAPPVDFCNVQYPKTIPPTPANTALVIYSRFYEPSITDRNTAGNDGYPYVSAQLGYGPVGTSATAWTWKAISFNAEYSATVSNDDEMMGSLRIPTAGSYKYGFRYAFQDAFSGTMTPWVYCDQNGVADPTNGIFGTVTIESAVTPPLTNHVVISEFSGGNGSAAKDEFIELYNPTNSPVTIGGWKVQYKSAAGTAYSNNAADVIPAGAVIQPKGYYLLGGTAYSGAVAKNAEYSFDSSASTSGGGHIRIGPNLDDKIATVAVDVLGYGTADSAEGGKAAPSHPAAGGSLERKAVSTSTSATMATGGADALRGNGYDTDDNSTNFVTRAVRDPQNASSPTETP
ncbi:lamin tail domain-containing protein [Melittangium boletus]|uniref:lamin tail domain-containing protein n=1 Tax=Melittangium boletus TaxID=83453 RepID=UPI003DA28222